MDEIQNLLSLWALPQLNGVFEAHEISLSSLKCLTENDICELISKIGPRSIFRERLKQWRRENGCDLIEISSHFEMSTDSKNLRCNERTLDGEEDQEFLPCSQDLNAQEFLENDVTANNIILKALPNSTVLPSSTKSIPEDECSSTNVTSSIKRKHRSTGKNITMETIDLEIIEEFNKRCKSSSSSSDKKLNVLEVLAENFDGRKAIVFYKINRSLDFHHRRKISNVIICSAIETKVAMNEELFDSLAKQIVDLFPNEKYETYFIPRVGSTSAKGTLYNRFINMSKQLWTDGLLEYCNQRS